jgi:hypothetical protein
MEGIDHQIAGWFEKVVSDIFPIADDIPSQTCKCEGTVKVADREVVRTVNNGDQVIAASRHGWRR